MLGEDAGVRSPPRYRMRAALRYVAGYMMCVACCCGRSTAAATHHAWNVIVRSGVHDVVAQLEMRLQPGGVDRERSVPVSTGEPTGNPRLDVAGRAPSRGRCGQTTGYCASTDPPTAGASPACTALAADALSAALGRFHVD